MKLVNPFAGVRPAKEYIDEIIAPPYDVVDRVEAYDFAHNRPWNFLHISKPEIDLAFDVDEHSPEVYAKGMENYNQLLNAGILCPDNQPNYYLYRLSDDKHSQLGLVAAVSVDAYLDKRILKHEHTRPAKEQDRIRHITTVNAQVSPVLLAYRSKPTINDYLQKLALDFKPSVITYDDDDVQHEFWVIDDHDVINQISLLFNEVDVLYIADGHHRSAAAAKVAELRSKNLKHQHGAHNYFLATLFPDDELRILSYNRIVSDLNSLSYSDFFKHLEAIGELREEDDQVIPNHANEVGIYTDSRWFRFHFPEQVRNPDNPAATLAVTLLDELILKNILAITDSRTDPRLDFIGGKHSVEDIEDAIDCGEAAVGFCLYPTAMDDLMTISDQGGIMPPKSTWFEPKLADGLICLSLDS